LVLERADLHGRAAAQQCDGADVLDLVAGGHTARAQDALLHIDHEEGIAVVNRGIRQWIEHRPFDAVRCGGVYQIVVCVGRIAAAVVRVHGHG